MPPQARVGDASMVPADAHGCPACPHSATGPAILGSPNVLTNGLPSVRVGDSGVHAACCGPNKWNAKTGSNSVLINGRRAHRLKDLVIHCGGMGNTIEGSPNVIVGDQTGFIANESAIVILKHQIHIRLLSPDGTRPISNRKVIIRTSAGQEFVSKTNQEGLISIKGIEPCVAEVLLDDDFDI